MRGALLWMAAALAGGQSAADTEPQPEHEITGAPLTVPGYAFQNQTQRTPPRVHPGFGTGGRSPGTRAKRAWKRRRQTSGRGGAR